MKEPSVVRDIDCDLVARKKRQQMQVAPNWGTGWQRGMGAIRSPAGRDL